MGRSRETATDALRGEALSSATMSFLSERTVEYSIVPPLVAHLRERIGCAVPMYFWASREGNSIAMNLHEGRRLRVVAVFARRPKLAAGNVIAVKLNAELSEFALVAASHGIPTFAGVPVVENLFDLGDAFSTLWLSMHDREPVDIHFTISSGSLGAVATDEHGRRMNTIGLDDISEAAKSATALDWRDVVKAIREARNVQRAFGGRGLFWGGGGYQPVYLLIPESPGQLGYSPTILQRVDSR